MKCVKILMNDTKKQKGNYISAKGWISYFKSLLNINKRQNSGVENSDPNKNIHGPLDFKR